MATRGWLAGPLLFVAVVSPPVDVWAEQSLVVHHFAHWLMVVAGALVGYQFRDLVRLPGRGAVATAGLVAALMWHVPPLLSWAEGNPRAHMFAHVTLVAGGAAMGWAVPRLGSAGRAYLFIAANVVMWPLVLAELAGAFAYADYPGQAAPAGLAELGAMSLSWLVLFLWSPLRKFTTSPATSISLQAMLAVAAIAGWSSSVVAG